MQLVLCCKIICKQFICTISLAWDTASMDLDLCVFSLGFLAYNLC